MNRRRFLQMLGLTPAAAALPAVEPVEASPAYQQGYVAGFDGACETMVPRAMAAGASAAYDDMEQSGLFSKDSRLSGDSRVNDALAGSVLTILTAARQVSSAGPLLPVLKGHSPDSDTPGYFAWPRRSSNL